MNEFLCGVINLVGVVGVVWAVFGLGYWEVGVGAMSLGIIAALARNMTRRYG